MTAREAGDNRRKAREAGLVRYEGRACARCGGTERFTTTCNCVVCNATWERERFHNMSGVEYNRRLLQMRRVKALRRMAARNGGVT